MKKIFFGIVVYCSIVSVYAQTWDFQDFKISTDKTIQEIYTNEDFLPLMDIDNAKQSLDLLSRSYDDITQSIDEIKERRDSLVNHSQKSKLILVRTLQDMESHQEEILSSQREITLMYSKMNSGEASIQTIQQDIQELQSHISKYSQMLYKISNDFYLSDQELSSVKLLSKSENFAKTLWEEDLMTVLHEQLQQSFWKIQNMYTIKQRSIFELQSLIASYTQTVKQHQKDLQTLQEQKDHISELVEYLDQDSQFIQQQYEALEWSKQELTTQMNRVEKITNSATRFIDQNTEVWQLLIESDSPDGATYFSRPHRIVEELLDAEQAWYPSDQSWVVLWAQQWQEIYAPAPAIVYKTQLDKNIWLQRVILLHKYGYVSIISPMSKIFVEPGDIVRRGDIIWLAWGAPGTIWSGLESTTPHTLFQIHKNAKPIEPELVLDMSIFVGAEQVDSLYQLKWKQDYLSRNIDLSDLPDLPWDTVRERKNYFLSKSGAGRFSDPSIRLQASEETGIDPVFGVCIWAAETSYRNFKSGNNIGNVWNDDSGNTRIFASPVDGVKAVFNTLNNSYLGEYTTMDQLSRYGNKDSYIYASDPINRQKNIMRCLSMIYEQHVPEKYFFRTVN